MIDKKHWGMLKSGVVKPKNDEERNALEQYRNDIAIERMYYYSQIIEPIRKYRGTTPSETTLRGFGKSERGEE